MKELSIEEKARRYDNLLVKLQEAKVDNSVCDERYCCVINDIVPELKESEDEKTRKELIDFVKSRLAGFSQCEKYIAWLEKQDNNVDKIKQQNIEIPFGAKDSELQEATYYIPDGYHAEINGNEVVIKQGEQKSVGKVEPKFHEGDFIKHNKANLICKVISVNNGSYYVENIETSCRIELFFAELSFYLWTIEDAKDGDVLVSDSNQPFIYNGKYTDSVVGAHIGISFNGEELFATKTNNWTMTEGVKPATKEQQDFLFQRMKKDGYEWDEDKKKLIKL